MANSFDLAAPQLTQPSTPDMIAAGLPPDMRKAMAAFVASAQAELQAGNAQGFRALGEFVLRAPDPYMASIAAVYGGTLVEQCGAPTDIAADLAMRFVHNAPLATEFLGREGSFEQAPDPFRAFHGMHYLVLALMTTLCRDRAQRVRARFLPGFMTSLQALYVADPLEKLSALSYLYRLMYSYDGELDVVIPEKGLGFRLRLDGVQNGFHLFGLLQAFLPDIAEQIGIRNYPPTDPHLRELLQSDTITGEFPTEIAALHGYADFSGWQAAKEGSLGLHGFVSGEQLVWSLPELDERRILVMSIQPVFGSRTWHPAIHAPLHDALRSGVTFERWLDKEEYAALEARAIVTLDSQG